MIFGRTYDNGYIVSVFYDMGDGMRWHPLRNFGEHQSDSIEFRNYDCQELTDAQVRLLIKNYSKDRIYRRINSRKFVIEKKQ